jgi:hypothetical protein
MFPPETMGQGFIITLFWEAFDFSCQVFSRAGAGRVNLSLKKKFSKYLN